MPQYNISRIPGKPNRNSIFYRLLDLVSLRLFLYLLCLSLLLLGFVVQFASFALKNKMLAQQNSWQYTFLIKDFMRQLPTLNPVRESKHYYFHLVYNPSTAQNIMTYQSRASASELISYYELYFNASNYFSGQQLETEDSVARFRNSQSGVEVYVKDYDEFRQVFIEYFPTID